MILLYHKVYPESPTKWWVTVNSFWRQMEQLRRFQVVALENYDPADPKQVVITFDGVYENVYTYALPILQKFGYPFELFIVGEKIGKGNDFDTREEPPARFADESQLQKMLKGKGRLQWHSLSHRDLSKVNERQILEHELTVPATIKQLDPNGFNWFAYPHGRHTDATVELVMQAFQGGLSCDAGNDSDRFQLNRRIVINETSFSRSTVSLIIANYNYGHLAAEAIESALSQTVVPDEILFVDDASVDGSIEVAKRYQDQIRIVRNEKNLGIINNFNKAVSLTKGDYICFLGADNRFRSDYVEKCKLALDTHPEAAIAYTHVVLFGPRAEVLAKKVNAKALTGISDYYLWEFPEFNDKSKKMLRQQNFIHGSSMYRREAFTAVCGYQSSTDPEDHNLFYRMVEEGWQAVLCPDFLLEYRQHSSNQANTQLNYAQELAYARRQLKAKENELQNLRQTQNMNRASSSQLPQLLHEIAAATHRGRVEEALQVAQNAFQRFPEQAKLSYQYALLLAYQKQFQAAQAQLEQALLYDPKLVEVHNDLGALLFQQGRSEDALPHFKLAVKYNPNFDVAWKNLAQLFLESDKTEEAVKIYQRILLTNPNDVETLLLVAGLFVQVGKSEDAQDFYHRVLAIQPDHPEAKQKLAILSKEDGKKKKDLSLAAPERNDLTISGQNGITTPQKVTASIIIPVFNKLKFTRSCLEYLFKNTPQGLYEIILVDDASTDQTNKWLDNLKDQIKVITNKKNLGFARCCNLGARAAAGEYLVFLNNDTLPLPDWLEAMLQVFSQDEKTGVVGAKLIYPLSHRIQHAGKVFRQSPNGRLEPYHIYCSEDETRPYVNKLREFQTLTAAALTIRKDDFFQVGLFDENYHNGWEDDDLCFKVRFQLQKKVIYQPKSALYHHELVTRKKMISDSESANQKIFYAKWQDNIICDEASIYQADGFQLNKIDKNTVVWKWRGEVISPEKKKILFVLLVNSGDVLLSTPIVREVRRLYPKAEISFVTAPMNVNLLETNPNIDQVIPFGSNHYSLETYESVREFTRDYDQVYYLQIWPNRKREFEQAMTAGQHLLEIYADNAGITITDSHCALFLTEDDRQEIDRQLTMYGIEESDRFVVLQPHAGDARKDWPIERFQNLIIQIRQTYYDVKIILIGGEETAQYDWEGVINLAGTLTFRQSAELIRRSELFIGIDSIGAHLAALWQKKSVILFGDTPPALSAPLNDYAVIVQSPVKSMTPISVAEVYQAAERQLAFHANSLTSVVVVTYNSKSTIAACLDSLRQQTHAPYEIIVVDNASSDGTAIWLQTQKDIQLTLNQQNCGFAAATNAGIRQAKGEFVVLLNPDTIVTPGWDIHLKNHFAPEVGAVGPVSNYAAGLQNVGQVMTSNKTESISIEQLGQTLFNRNRSKGIETKLLIGFCMMIKKEAMDKVGLLDEELFLGNDDLDYSLRLREASFRLVVAADTFVYHEGQSSFKTLTSSQKNRLMQTSLDRFFEKLEHKYGIGKVPSSLELWDLDILGIPSRFKESANFKPLLIADEGISFKDKRVALIYDNVVRPDTTGEYCQLALQKICQVDHYLPGELNQIQPEHYDLFLYIDDGLRYEIPFQFRPNAWWVIDTHLQYDFDLKKAQNFDVVFSAQKDGAEKLKRDGIANVFWLPLAADPEIHSKHPVEKEFDIAFVGNRAPGIRNQLLAGIQAKFERVFIGRRFFKEMAKTYSSAKIVFNRSLKNDINMRVFEAMSCGSLLVTNDLSENGMNELFQTDKCIVSYQDEKDLYRKLDFYLKHENKREQIAVAGREEILTHHTYVHRLQALLQKVFALAAAKEKIVPEHPLVSIVLVTYNGLAVTQNCMNSIRQFTSQPYELIVVDNGSTDGSVAYLQDLSDVQVVLNQTNLGFAAANNIGLQKSRGDYIVLLNNDTVVTEGWLEGLLRAAKLSPNVGLVGSKTNFVHEDSQRVDKVDYQTAEELQEFARNFAAENKNRYAVTTKLVGFCLLIKKKVVAAIGFLDEEFGIGNFEDDDYGIRARLAGFHLVVAGDVFIHHEGNYTFKANGISYQNQIDKNLKYFRAKWQEQIEFRGERYYLKQDLAKFARQEVSLGEKAFSTGDWQTAKIHFDKALVWNDTNAIAHNNLGVIYWQQQDFTRAKTCFLAAVHNNPGYLDALNNLSVLLTSKEELAQIHKLIQSVAKQKEWLPLLYKLGVLWLQFGEQQEASEYFSQIQRLKPTAVEAMVGYAQVEWQKGNYQLALQILDDAAQNDPQHRDLNLQYALMAFQLGHQQEAVQLLSEYVKNHKDSEIQHTLAQMQNALPAVDVTEMTETEVER